MDKNTHIAQSEIIIKSVFVFLVLASLFLLASTYKTLTTRASNSIEPMITVSGSGEAFAIPDIAIVTFDVRKEAKDVGSAQKLVNDIIDPIVKDLGDDGIEKKDIKTTSYNSYPVYDYRQTAPCYTNVCPPVQNQTLRGYEVSQSIQIKIRNIDNSGEVLSYLGDSGVTNLSGLSFIVDDEDGVKAEARAQAIANAKAKAKILSKELGVRLGKVVSFNEDFGYPYTMYEKSAVGMGGDSMTRPTANVAVPAGENKYVSNISITFRIK
jgi:hypothetical protein